jgi:hypothetical protein
MSLNYEDDPFRELYLNKLRILAWFTTHYKSDEEKNTLFSFMTQNYFREPYSKLPSTMVKNLGRLWCENRDAIGSMIETLSITSQG